MESVDADSERDEILKDAQETNPEGEDNSDTGAPNILNAQTSSLGDLIEAISLLQKALAVHGASSSGQADTTVISSKPDTFL